MSDPLKIDIISDVMCPWCIIGYRQLAAALEETGTPHEIQWHPFELNPQMPPEGQNTREHIMEKYGSTAEQSEQSRRQMKELGESLGFDFAWDENSRMHNTFNTHQLLHWANTQGRMHDLKQALFTAHFTEQRNLSDNAVLADVAAGIGLDRAEAEAVLEDQRYAEEVRREEQFWQQQGITGVPAMVFDRKHLVTGAQGVDNYRSILKQLAEMRA
ncbi:DsbA family oxidoreductase [Gymnodinialimonas ceratoperidinii]|uniref:DsbA family oxidoreductase n=1 Tax=Gymnodinialimonas ceratoperidinii TaxID=2856823 RepID=A0A8F6YEP1_9RHOB|nr:DsbA family oxidoreductase [Gymnodinialimonas ceratoperidinii]QXT41422.1 DsbA family oxidoreductase [Gymnodinialimonas ceratoperidinii]